MIFRVPSLYKSFIKKILGTGYECVSFFEEIQISDFDPEGLKVSHVSHIACGSWWLRKMYCIQTSVSGRTATCICVCVYVYVSSLNTFGPRKRGNFKT